MKHEKIIINNRAELVTYCLDNDPELYVKARPSILIYPGGGYAFCSRREAEQVAITFNNAGFNAFIINYTCQQGYEEAYKDGSEAFKYLYERKEEYAIGELLVCGFSAGAHLSASVATRMNIKPAGMILIYPPLQKEDWTSMCPSAVDVLELIDEKTPKAFIVHAYDDELVPVKNTYRLMQLLDENNVEFESHVFRAGGHGFSIASEPIGQNEESYKNNRKNAWVNLCISWIKEGIGNIEFLERTKLDVNQAPDILQQSFKDFFGNSKQMEVINELYPGIYEENAGKPTEGFPLAGLLIYTRIVNMLDLELLAEKLRQAK